MLNPPSQIVVAVKAFTIALPSKSLNRLGSSSLNQLLPQNAPRSALNIMVFSIHLLALPGFTSPPFFSSLYTKSSFLQKTLLHQNMNCQSGYIILFKPVLGSIAQFVQPLAQTNFFASRCVHSKSRCAASGQTSTVAGADPNMEGMSDWARYEGRDLIIGERRRRVKFIWHSTV